MFACFINVIAATIIAGAFLVSRVRGLAACAICLSELDAPEMPEGAPLGRYLDGAPTTADVAKLGHPIIAGLGAKEAHVA